MNGKRVSQRIDTDEKLSRGEAERRNNEKVRGALQEIADELRTLDRLDTVALLWLADRLENLIWVLEPIGEDE